MTDEIIIGIALIFGWAVAYVVRTIFEIRDELRKMRKMNEQQ